MDADKACGSNKKRLNRNSYGLSPHQLQLATSACLQGVDPSHFEEKIIDDYIGAGVFAKKLFKKGDFLLEYQGDLISYKEARKREETYKSDESAGNFMFFFKYNEKTMCVDATNEIFSMGRMANDAAQGHNEENSAMKIVVVERCPRLCLFAIRDIQVGEEIRYDYGVPNLPWRMKTKNYPDGKVVENMCKEMDYFENQEGDNRSNMIRRHLSQGIKDRKIENNEDNELHVENGVSSPKRSKREICSGTNISDIYSNSSVEMDVSDMEFDSGSEYFPSEENEDDEYVSDSGSSEIIPVQANRQTLSIPNLLTDITKRNKYLKNDDSKIANNTEPQQQSSEHIEISDILAEDDNNHGNKDLQQNNLTVPNTNNSPKIRSYDKLFYCMFCKKGLKKLPPHLKSQHADEKEIIEWESEKDLEKKKMLYNKIRNIGSHIHNCDITIAGTGELCVRYRPTFGSSHIDEYGPCPHCYGYYRLRDLWRHSCPLKPTESEAPNIKVAKASKLLSACPTVAHSALRTIIASMRVDSISRLVKGDTLIMDFGKKLCTLHGHEQDKHNYIRQKVRELGRLLKEIKNKFPEFVLADIINPKHYQLVIEASKIVSGFDPLTNRYQTPSLALKIGQSLQKCTNIFISSAIQNGNRDHIKRGEEFSKLLEIEWEEDVSSNALKTLYESKRNSTKSALPIADDVKTLIDFLTESASKHYECLVASKDTGIDTKKSFAELTEITLAKTIIFNRRRSGEVSKMKLDDYFRKDISSRKGDPVTESLSATEKHLCKTLKRVEISGKRGRTVPVIFSQEIISYLDEILQKRHLFVNEQNQYLFARTFYESRGHLRGSDCIRKYAHACNAIEPNRLTSTRLRKQIATMSQILNLKKNELDILANFMGHDINIHREYYRLPEATMQVAKVSKLLLLMEKGGQGLKAGETLDNISLEDLNEKSQGYEDLESSNSEWESDGEDVDSHCEEPQTSALDSKIIQEDSKKNKKRYWTSAEKQAVYRHLQRFIDSAKLPGKRDVDNAKKKNQFCRTEIGGILEISVGTLAQLLKDS